MHIAVYKPDTSNLDKLIQKYYLLLLPDVWNGDYKGASSINSCFLLYLKTESLMTRVAETNTHTIFRPKLEILIGRNIARWKEKKWQRLKSEILIL